MFAELIGAIVGTTSLAAHSWICGEPSVELRLLTSRVNEILYNTQLEHLAYRGRMIRNNHSIESHSDDLQEVLGLFSITHRGLYLSEFLQQSLSGELMPPVRIDTFTSFETGTVAASKLLHGNPRPVVQLFECASLPEAWWYLIGRVPPLTSDAVLLSESAASSTDEVCAIYTLPSEERVQVYYEPDGPRLSRIVYKQFNGITRKNVLLLSECDKARNNDVVLQPLLVVAQDFDADGHETAVRAWLRLDDLAVVPARIPAGSSVAAYRREPIFSAMVLRETTLEEVESWYWIERGRAMLKEKEASSVHPSLRTISNQQSTLSVPDAHIPKDGLTNTHGGLGLLMLAVVFVLCGILLKALVRR